MELVNAPSRARGIHRTHLVSVTLAVAAFAVWLVGYATNSIDSLREPWDSLIYGAIVVSLVALAVTSSLAVVASAAGWWRLLRLGPLVAVGFLWWVLAFYGQASVGIGAGTDRDVISQLASQPSYAPVMTALTMLTGLPLVVP
jgi:hypothetical protein